MIKIKIKSYPKLSTVGKNFTMYVYNADAQHPYVFVTKISKILRKKWSFLDLSHKKMSTFCICLSLCLKLFNPFDQLANVRLPLKTIASPSSPMTVPPKPLTIPSSQNFPSFRYSHDEIMAWNKFHVPFASCLHNALGNK